MTSSSRTLICLWFILAFNRCRAKPVCQVKSESDIEKVKRVKKKNDIPKRVSTLDLSSLNFIKCASNRGEDTFYPDGEAAADASTPNSNLELQFMPDQEIKKYKVFYDTSLSDGLIEGQGVSGPEVDSYTNGTGTDGEINLVVGKSGGVVGSARSRSKIYHFADTPNGVTRVMEIDLSDLPRETDPKVEKPSDLRGLRSTNINDIEEIRRLQEIKLTYIDILVPYTKRTLCKLVYGEATMKCPVDDTALGLMQTFAELNIYESNKAFANSGIDGRFRLAKAYMVDEDYDESSNSFPLILKHISTPDGVIDDVFSMRERWGADMVAFLVDQPDSCGLAFTGYPVSKDWTFAVVYWQCAAGYYSFVHELSHNLGANHDRDTEACPNTECCRKGCTNYGYRDLSMKFRTIMAYECPVYGGCPRIQMFSQPQLPYTIGRDSFIVGNIVNDNAKQIRMSWDIVASYRKETNPLVIDSNPLLAPSNPQTPVPEAIARQSQQNSTKTQTQTQPTKTQTQTQAQAQTQKSQTTALKACGNGVCEPNHRENCLSCPGDCIGGIFKGTYCGDGICQYKENCVNCPEDCPGRDTGTEEQKFCCSGGFMPREPKKTGPGSLQKTVGCRHPYCRWNVFCDHNQIRYPEWNKGDPVKTFCCGNGKCEPGESNITCPADCQGGDGTIMLPKRCMTDGRYCVDITPDPCCGRCNLDSRQCETSKK